MTAKKRITKKYYWYKFMHDFFQRRQMIKLESQPDGDRFMVIYMKMIALSIKQNGYIMFEETDENIAEQVAIETRSGQDVVEKLFTFLSTQKMINIDKDQNIEILEVVENIGQESESAERTRKWREKGASRCDAVASQCDKSVTPEKEKEKEKEEDIIYCVSPNTKSTETKTSPKSNNIAHSHDFSNFENTGIFMRVPLLEKNTYFEIDDAFVERHKALYPGIDVEQELRNILAWNLNRPADRKSREGFPRHVETWMKNEKTKNGEKNDYSTRISNKPKLSVGQEISRKIREQYGDYDNSGAGGNEKILSIDTECENDIGF